MNALQKPAHVLRINAGGDAVSQVGDPALADVLITTKSLAHSFHPILDGFLAAVQQAWIEVALE